MTGTPTGLPATINPNPTIGRVVHYFANAGDISGIGPHAAIVTHVWTDEMINLVVFPANGGNPTTRTSVHDKEHAPEYEGRVASHWDWPARV